MTYPLIGNYGVIPADFEGKCAVRGYVVRELCRHPSNFRSEYTLDEFLKRENVCGICGIDTRALTIMLRSEGVMNGKICDTPPESLDELRDYRVKGVVAEVSSPAPAVYPAESEEKFKVALSDYGAKANIVRCLQKRGCRVTVLPGTTTAAQLAELHPDGLMLSNGPGDPAENVEIIANIRKMLSTGIPTFGICLGHQLTALAAGAHTCKLKYGHRGANQPVTHAGKARTFITSQNHGYAVESETLPTDVGQVSYVNANDGTCEGVDYFQWNCFTVQFHPEANGGPKDTEFLFDEFVSRMLAAKGVIADA